ncbi:Uncharacterized protein TCM_017437 [Theobroma cacao]|uniref:Uncharacterized protein n=1 Tax=Theobroma cacao TaxID=3641 RepID=A0A061EEG9_THECC|nr:Uncharacterized protein TCM_017437 [Theobroma cacao]
MRMLNFFILFFCQVFLFRSCFELVPLSRVAFVLLTKKKCCFFKMPDLPPLKNAMFGGKPIHFFPLKPKVDI